MNRQQVTKDILQRLGKIKIKYQMVKKSANEILVQIDVNQKNFEQVGMLEDSLAGEGITFDTGYDTKKQQRYWNLDSSLTVAGKTPGKSRRVSPEYALEVILDRLVETRLKYKIVNKGSDEILVQFDINQEYLEQVEALEDYFAGRGFVFDTGNDPAKQLRVWQIRVDMTRKEALEEVLHRLIETTFEYDIVIKGSDEIRVQFDANQDNFKGVRAMEDFFREEGIGFAARDDAGKQMRVWNLDSSLTVGGKVPGKSPRKSRKGINYKVGDVIQVPLDNEGHKGYGRILIEDAPTIFAEFYKVVSKEDLPPETFQNVDWFLRMYTGDMGLVREKTWKVIGNIPVSEFTMPIFWLHYFDNETFVLYKDPVLQKNPKKTTREEIKRLRAQYGGRAGHKAMEGYLAMQLKEEGLL